MTYHIVDHTADLKVRIMGGTEAELFAHAASALFDLVIQRRAPLKANRPVAVTVEGRDWPDLMVAWMRELLYLWNGRELVVEQTHIQAICEHRIEATVWTAPFHPDAHAVKTEIKAVTYHQIQVTRRLTGWEATVIFDV